MESQIKHCIINASNGKGWYPKGTERLKRSLIYHGFNGDILTWDKFPNNNYDESCPYNIKAAAFEEAISLGYTHILWLDCSVWAVNDPNKIFDVINAEGHYVAMSGYNCAQTCSDKCLDYFNINRNEAEKMLGCSSGVMGVNIENPSAYNFINAFIKAAKAGVFEGSREHDNQSQDPRFLFYRQDQSVASVIMGLKGMKMYEPNIYAGYYDQKENKSITFLLRGM